MAVRMALCTNCDHLIPLDDVPAHSLTIHRGTALSLTHHSPTPWPSSDPLTVADQLDQAAAAGGQYSTE